MEVHAHPDQAFDPNVQYAPCCHPSMMPPGTVARDTYEQHRAVVAAAHEAAAEARRSTATSSQNQ